MGCSKMYAIRSTHGHAAAERRVWYRHLEHKSNIRFSFFQSPHPGDAAYGSVGDLPVHQVPFVSG